MLWICQSFYVPYSTWLGGGGGGTYMTTWRTQKYIYSDNEKDIHTSSKNYEANGYEHNLGSLTMSHESRVS